MRRAVVLLFAIALPLGAAEGQNAADAGTAKGVFESACSRCHPLDRALRKTKDRPGWQKTVERMKGYAAGSLSDAEAQTIVEYLSRVRGPAKP